MKPIEFPTWPPPELCDGLSSCLHTTTPSVINQERNYIQNADALSRLPRPVTTSNDCTPADVVAVVEQLSSSAVDAQTIKQWTIKDPTLSCVHRFVLSGWPAHKLNPEFQPYVNRKDELSILDGCILWSSHVVIPPQGRKPLLEELHNTHLGASKMKALAHCYL